MSSVYVWNLTEEASPVSFGSKVEWYKWCITTKKHTLFLRIIKLILSHDRRLFQSVVFKVTRSQTLRILKSSARTLSLDNYLQPVVLI